MYSDLASPFEELRVNADNAGGKLVLMRSSDDCTTVTVRRALDVSHGKFRHCLTQIYLPSRGWGGGEEQFVV
jgi:hypothetical protein